MMKRFFALLSLLVCLSFIAVAQSARSFRNTPLLEALQTIGGEQTEYSIDILSEGLADLRVTAEADSLSVPGAVELICRNLPVKVKVRGRDISVQYDKRKEVKTLKLTSKVEDIRAHKALIGGTVELLSADSTVLQQVEAKRQMRAYGGDQYYEWTTSDFSFTVPAKPADYIFRIAHEGFQTACVAYRLERIGRREHERELPPFYLRPEPKAKTMQEVTVTASRVKFYYKGDTLIYNADAFVLAEGSMLDALIKQMPGMELKSDGRIYYNGEFVDDLLLNGKQLFAHDRRLLLENLPAYTVKEVQLYNKQTAENEWLGRKDEQTQRCVLDVLLKKEYMIGWMANVEAGGGTGDRYLGRVFAMRHSEFSRLAVVANANNLDDSSKPSEGGQWERSADNALRRNEMAAVDFRVERRDHRWAYNGGIDARHSTEKQDQRTTAQTFLPQGDTYEYLFSQARNEDWRLKSSHDVAFTNDRLMLHISPEASYHRFRHENGSASGLFSAPVSDASRQLLDDLFSSATQRPDLRDTLINRQLREGLGTGHNLETNAIVWGMLKMKRSNDVLGFSLSGNYSENAREQFSRQSVAYAAPAQPLFRHQYTDLSPRRKVVFTPSLDYKVQGKGWRSIMIQYDFTHRNQREHESIYRLDRLTGADSTFARPIDRLPSVSEYQQVIDRNNSHLSHYIDNEHKVYVNAGYEFKKTDRGQFLVLTNMTARLTQQEHEYERGSIDTTLRRVAPTFDIFVRPWFRKNDGRYIGLSMSLKNEVPELLNQAAVVDDTDPMNIRIGNPDLHASLRTGVGLEGTWNPSKLRWRNMCYVDYGFTRNAIGMGQTYDRQTGIRTYRPENVNGNWDASAKHTLRYSFGEGKKHSMDITSNFNYRNSVDLMAETGAAQATRSIVRNAALSVAPKLSLTLGKHALNITSDVSWNRYTGDRSTFQHISAWQYRIGADGTVHLPWKFDLTTDLTLYGRTGYADAQLNTADLVWNARLARPFCKGKLLVMVDGFDILGQLSNVTRTVNAQGRTETYTNVMPRYALLHVMYRFTKHPKKKGK